MHDENKKVTFNREEVVQNHRILSGVLLILLLGTFYIARAFLLPLVASLFIYYALLPVVRMLVRIKIPRALSAAIVVALSFLLMGIVLISITGPALKLLERAPRSMDKVSHLREMVGGSVSRVKEATEKLENFTDTEDPRNKEVEVKLKETGIGETILDQTPAFFGALFSTFLLVYFLLAFGEDILRKAVQASPNMEGKREAVRIARNIEHGVSRYLVTVTVINICLGLVVGGLLYLLDFKNPFFWGAIATLFNYIPYLGAMAGVVLLLAASLIAGGSIQEMLLYPGIYLASTLIEGNFITPLILGKTFSLNPVFIIIALLFLGWLWGVAGAVLAVPVLVGLKISSESSSSWKGFSLILSR